MARIYAEYNISSLQVLVSPGEQFTLREDATNKKYYILIKIGVTQGLIVDVQRGILFGGGAFPLAWTERINQIPDPENPGETIDDPNAESYFTADMDEMLAGAAGGISIKAFVKAGWQFSSVDELAHILRDQPEPDPEPQTP